ncbi:MAG: hypothetical protein KJ070_25180 [Verrucomicrobia bacterium]|nr:hypothetical protein [Verrucomicrobiota bacterium]
MSTVKEIEEAIAQLPKDEFWQLTDRLVARRNAEWDRQIEEDICAGKLDKLAEEALREQQEGKTRPFPA